MNESEQIKIVNTWIELQKCHRNKGDCDSLFWAYEKLDDLIDNKPEKAFELIKKIYATDQSDIICENLAAGPIEDLLTRHGEKVIEIVILTAKENPSFCNLLGGVWQNSIQDNIWTKLQKVVKSHNGDT